MGQAGEGKKFKPPGDRRGDCIQGEKSDVAISQWTTGSASLQKAEGEGWVAGS